MNAAHIRKRNESVTQMWHCLAGAEFSAWVLSGLHLSGYNFLPLLVLSLFALCLVIAALLHYVVACEHYASAKGNKKPFESAGMAFLFSLFVSFLFIGLAVTHHAFGTAYFGVPLAFALGALPLQCLRDRCWDGEVVAFAALSGDAWTIYFVLPAVFWLAVLPLKLMRDRSWIAGHISINLNPCWPEWGEIDEPEPGESDVQ